MENNSKDTLLIELMIKTAAINKVLVAKGIITEEEIHAEMKLIAEKLSEEINKITLETTETTN